MPITARKVVQCDQDGNPIASFDSALLASRACNGKTATSIHRAIRYGLLAFGYRWKYEDEPLKPRSDGTPGKRRKVIALDLSSNEETLFESMSEASRSIGIRLSAIESAIQTGCKAKGYRFRYEGEGFITPSKSAPYRKKVVALDDEDNPAIIFESAYEAAEKLRVNPSAIYWCLNPKHHSSKCKGYRFRYR